MPSALDARSPLEELRQKMYARLNTDLSESVYSDVPEGTSYPYVVTGDDDVQGEMHSGKTYDFRVDSDVHCWSQQRSTKELTELMTSVIDSLTASPLALADNFDCFLRFDRMIDFLEEDGITRHGVITFVSMIMDTS